MSFPWAYVVPGRQYFKLLRIIKACPEIAHLIHEGERLRLKMFGVMVLTSPYLLLMVTLAAICMSLQWISEQIEKASGWPNPYRPISRAMDETTRAAHKILSPQEIRRRITA